MNPREPGRHTAPTSILDIPVSVSKVTTSIPPVVLDAPEAPTEIHSHFAEIPEPIPHEVFATDDTTLITVPSYDYSFHEQVERDLQVKLVDLESWILLQNKYGTPAILASSINSDLVILGRSERVEELGEFS